MRLFRFQVAPWLGALLGGAVLSACAESVLEEGSLSAQLAALDQGGRFVPGQAIVKLRGGNKRDLGPSALGALRAEAIGGDWAVVTLDAGPGIAGHAGQAAKDERIVTAQLLHELAARADVEYAHANWIFEMSAVPNDTYFPRQWSATAIGLPAAWDITLGSSMTRIAIIDTGRASHGELNNKWVSGVEYDAAAQDGDASAGASDTWRHAVAVAGVAGGAANNGQGIAGACQHCQLLNVKVSTNNVPQMDAIIRALQWSLDNRAQVVNMSFESNGLPCSDPQMRAIYDMSAQAMNQNVVLVAAAGNRGVNAATVVPASCPGVISVAASDQKDRLASYSSRGAVTLTAPGGGASLDLSGPAPRIGPEAYGPGLGCPADPASTFGTSESGVFTTWSTSNGTPCYRYLSGTSLAAPHVAGVVGLMLSRNPSLTPGQVRSILQSTATPMPECGGQCGAGLLNADAAVRQAAPLPVGDAPPVPGFTVQCFRLQCTFDARSSTDDRGILAYQWRLPGQQLRSGPVTSFFMPGYQPSAVELHVVDTSGQRAMLVQQVAPPSRSTTPLRGSYENPQRPGNTLDFFHNDFNDWYVTWYTYRPDGSPIWYISDTGQIYGSTWSAVLYRASWTGTGAALTAVGEVRLSFNSNSEAWFAWSLNGASGGERVVYRGGGWGRSGGWYSPAEPGWGFSLQEIGTGLEATYSIYEGSVPLWMRGTGQNTSSSTMNLQIYKGPGLCPACGGRGPATVDDGPSGTASVNVPTASSMEGVTSVTAQKHYLLPPFWLRTNVPILRLTSP